MKRKTLILMTVIALVLTGCGEKTISNIETMETEVVINKGTTAQETIETESVEPETEVQSETETEEIAETTVEQEETQTEVAQVAQDRTDMNDTVYVTKTSNLREGPSTDFNVLARASAGDSLQRTATIGKKWSEVTYNNQICYISNSLIQSEPYLVTTEVEVEPAAPTSAEPATTSAGMETKYIYGGTRYQSYTTPRGIKIYTTQPDARWEDFIIEAIDASGVTNEMTEYEKCVAINNYVMAVVDPISLEPGQVVPADHALKCGWGTCFEYADSYQTLLCALGIQCHIVDGNAGGSSHKWNRVLADGTWYYNDVMANDNSASKTRCLMSVELWDGWSVYNEITY